MNSEVKVSKPDVVIVLANQMDANGVLNSESKARAKRAVQLVKNKNIPYLVTCGWAYREDSDIKIADAFKRYIVNDLGLNPEIVIAELSSRDTVGDAFFTKTNLALPLSWKKIVVVTSGYHVERTKEIFNFIYGNDFIVDVSGANVFHEESIVRNELSSTKAFRETFLGVEIGNDSQILERLRERHPFYNGKIYGKI